VSGYTDLEMTVRGETEPNATVRVSNLPENPTVTADEEGQFEVTVGLLPGSNVIQLVASDPATDRDSEMVERTVLVVTDAASPSAAPVALTLASPAEGTTVTGPVPVTGTAAPNAEIIVSMTLVKSPTPRFQIVDGSGQPVALQPTSPAPPEPLTLTADATGAYAGELGLKPGGWQLAVSADGGEPVMRRVNVAAPRGLRALIVLAGAASYLEVEEDGTPIDGVWGTIASPGDRVDMAASNELRILAGNAGAVRVTINGIDIGAMGGSGAVVEWRITPAEG
jgi:uncharacterized protein DUF4115